MDKGYTAVVQKIVKNGKHGPYAVASSGEFENITFSLEPSVWKEESLPEAGSVVVLSLVNKKRAGWRANLGRFSRPSDDKNKQQQ